MGVMICGPNEVEFDDRLLTHLQVVIVTKFRRGESFLMSWIEDEESGGGQTSLWMSPKTPVYFKYYGSRVPSLDRDWIQRLEVEANGSRGLIVLGEDGAPAKGKSVGHEGERPTDGVS